jgi:hypothetical protein
MYDSTKIEWSDLHEHTLAWLASIFIILLKWCMSAVAFLGSGEAITFGMGVGVGTGAGAWMGSRIWYWSFSLSLPEMLSKLKVSLDWVVWCVSMWVGLGEDLAEVQHGGIVMRSGSGMSFQTGTYINCPVMKFGKDIGIQSIRYNSHVVWVHVSCQDNRMIWILTMSDNLEYYLLTPPAQNNPDADHYTAFQSTACSHHLHRMSSHQENRMMWSRCLPHLKSTDKVAWSAKHYRVRTGLVKVRAVSRGRDWWRQGLSLWRWGQGHLQCNTLGGVIVAR